MEQEKDVRTELRELTDSASLLLDEQTYTKESCDRLIEAIGLAKVALQNWKADDETLRQACDGLCEAVDGLQNAEEASACKRKSAKKEKRKEAAKPAFTWRKAAPYVICGAAIIGSAAYLVASLSRKPQPKKMSLLDWFKKW
ncbi:MAG: hypothetical protein J5843_04605 [Clostridia bacterium]|nr:hypothetical protein [Clostridia bacterium]